MRYLEQIIEKKEGVRANFAHNKGIMRNDR